MRTVPAFDISSLHAFYADGGKAEDVIEAVFARIAAVNDPGIFISIASKADLLAQAAALGTYDPSAKTLWGITYADKDNIDDTAMPTTAPASPDPSADRASRKNPSAVIASRTPVSGANTSHVSSPVSSETAAIG